MGTERPAKTLARAFHIRPGEGRAAALFFSYLFLVAGAHTIVKSLRTTDFMVKMGVGALPIAYLFAAVVTGLVVLLHWRIQFRTAIRTLIISSLVFFAVTGLALQLILPTEFGRRSAPLAYLYWVWASVLAVALLTHFWMTTNEMFDPGQARRLIGFLTTGGILGSILGGLLVGLLSRTPLAVGLLPLACGMLLGCILVVRAIFRLPQKWPPAAGRPHPGEAAPEGLKAGFQASFDAVRRNKFLALIAGSVVVGVIVSTCIEFQYLASAFSHFDGRPRALQAFFGFFEPTLTLGALVLNVLVSAYLFRKLDTTGALLVTPACLFAGSLAVLRLPFGLPSGILVKGVDESLAFAVNSSVRETLYIPVAAPLRHKAKPFIDMFISQFAKVAGACVLIAFAALLHTPVKGLTPVFNPGLAKELSWVVIAFLIPWVWLSLKLGKGYVATLRGNIHPLWDRAEADVAAKLDVEHAKLVFDTIDSRNYSSVLYALHLFDLLAQDKLSPDIKAILAEKSGELRAAALTDRFGATGAAEFAELLDEWPPEDMLAEIPLIMSSHEYLKVMAPYFEKALSEGSDSEVKKMELAKAAGLMPADSPLAARLSRLIDDSSPRVASFALKSAARLRRPGNIPAIIRRLGNFLTLEDAVDALHKYGDTAVRTLDRTMAGRSAEITVKRAAVEVLARIGSPRAVAAMANELERGSGDLDDVLIDALDRLRAAGKEIPFGASAVRGKTVALIRKYCWAYLDLEALKGQSENAALREHLTVTLEATLADIFKLLGLAYPQQDIRTAYQNIRTGSRASVAHAVEWLGNALKKDIKEGLLPLVEDLDPVERERQFRKILKASAGD